MSAKVASLLLVLSILHVSNAFEQVTDANCKMEDVGCLKHPSGCSLSACTTFVKWQKKKDYVAIEMFVRRSTANRYYVAIAFSSDKIMVCFFRQYVVY